MTPRPPSPFHLIATMCVAETLGMIGIFTFPTLLPHFQDLWQLTNTEAGWINGIYFAGYTIGVPLLGGLTDRVDGRKIYLIFMAVGALAALGFALVAQGFWTALLFRALAGLGLAGTFIPGLKILVDRLEDKAQARSISFYTAFFSIGTSLSYFASGQIHQWLGWRWAFGIGAIGATLALALVVIVIRPVVRDPNLVNTGLFDFRPVLKDTKVMAYILAYVAHMWELFAVRSWMVAFLAFSLSLQPKYSDAISPASIAALASLIATWASIVGAELAIRFGRSRVVSLIMGISAIFACGIGFAASLPYPLLALLVVIYTLFVQGDSAALHTGVVQSADPHRRGTTMAVQSLLGFASAFASPLAIGLVLDMTGAGKTTVSWGMAFIAMGIVVAAGPIVLAVFSRKS